MGSQEVFVLLIIVDIPGIVGATRKFVETRGLLGLQIAEVWLGSFFGEPEKP